MCVCVCVCVCPHRADGGAALYSVGTVIVFGDPESGLPYYFDTLTGEAVWEEPDTVSAFKAANPEMFPEGRDEMHLCEDALAAVADEIGAEYSDPTASPDYIGTATHTHTHTHTHWHTGCHVTRM